LCEDSADNEQGGALVPLPEQQARGNIDLLLKAAGWHVGDASATNIHAARAFVMSNPANDVPIHLRNASTKLMKDLLARDLVYGIQ
jgi:hypothetical protein